MSQSLSSITIHLVFSTKNRQPFITEKIESDLFSYLGGAFKDQGAKPIGIGGYRDHVHALFVLQRTQTIASVVEEVKKRSSKWIKTKGPEWCQFQWQGGYAAFSVGCAQLPGLKRYISSQREHHQQRTFEDELRTMLTRYEVAFDERYLWD